MMDSMSSPEVTERHRSIYVGNTSTCARVANQSTSQMDPKYVMKAEISNGTPEHRQGLKVTVKEKTMPSRNRFIERN